MAKIEEWKKRPSRQIAVYKTDKALLELLDSLKPAHARYPAHIHASGQEEENKEHSLIRLEALDYSKGTGEKSFSTYANISPEEAQYLYAVVSRGQSEFTYSQEKIFGKAEKEGYANVTKLYIARHAKTTNGEWARLPWYVSIANGRAKPQQNANGGTCAKQGTYEEEHAVSLKLTDLDMFRLFCRANAWIVAFELEHAYRSRWLGNFNKLYLMLRDEIRYTFADGEENDAA